MHQQLWGTAIRDSLLGVFPPYDASRSPSCLVIPNPTILPPPVSLRLQLMRVQHHLIRTFCSSGHGEGMRYAPPACPHPADVLSGCFPLP